MFFRSILENPDGSFMVAGYIIYCTAEPTYDCHSLGYVLKVDNDGYVRMGSRDDSYGVYFLDKLGERIKDVDIRPLVGHYPKDLQRTADGAYVMCGGTYGITFGTIIKIGADGSYAPMDTITERPLSINICEGIILFHNPITGNSIQLKVHSTTSSKGGYEIQIFKIRFLSWYDNNSI